VPLWLEVVAAYVCISLPQSAAAYQPSSSRVWEALMISPLFPATALRGQRRGAAQRAFEDSVPSSPSSSSFLLLFSSLFSFLPLKMLYEDGSLVHALFTTRA